MAEQTLEQSVLAYVAAWNTTDSTARRELLERSFAADGTYTDPAASVVGRVALAEHLRVVAQRRPGASIAVTSPIDAHDGAGCFTGRLVAPDGATLREGIDFVAADADGLLGEVRGFFGAYRAPAGESADHSSGLLSPS